MAGTEGAQEGDPSAARPHHFAPEQDTPDGTLEPTANGFLMHIHLKPPRILLDGKPPTSSEITPEGRIDHFE
jgi:hypothetical protein